LSGVFHFQNQSKGVLAMAKESRRDYAGYGPTDGVQSEASTEEAEKLVGGRVPDVNVETGWSKKTRFTGESDKA
jgi:hypothetical protein